MPRYTNHQYVEMLLLYGECGRNARAAATMYGQRHPGVQQPSKTTILLTVRRAQRTGSVARVNPPGRPRTATNEANSAAVLAYVHVNPHTSSRDIEQQSGVSSRSVLRILHSNRFHPFHVHCHQGLEDRDYPCRVDFCNWLTLNIEQQDDFLSNILWTDESQFTRDGVVNTHNAHYWSVENPHWLRETRHQVNWRVNVWCGILGDRIIGPVFYQGTLNGGRYRQMILEGVVDELVDELPLASVRQLWYQHDGAPPHFLAAVREHLDTTFPDKWIGRGGPVHWPARSPDLSPLDFFLWGYVKDRVYKTQPTDVADLERRIREACATVTPDMLAAVHSSTEHRAQYCIGEEGRHFEHILS
jgi:hypothetical protein